MRINHNIASLNTYRQLTGNTTNTSKSLEKLSSGLRINRAGDDAAGLAISEKMRAQIRGLDQASRNSQDAISLIQTAEGALNETHSILQRMRELATQAANDTNTDVDRGEIQKEINQLTSEINRIGNTTEFNKRTLLDGNIGINGNGKAESAEVGDTVLGAGITDIIVDSNASAAIGTYDVKVTSDIVAQIESTVLSDITGATVTAGDTVDLAGGAYKIAITAEDTKQLDGNAADASSILNTSNNNTPITLESNSTLNNVGHTLTVAKAQTASAVGSGMTITTGQLDNIDSGTYTITTNRVFSTAPGTIADDAGETLLADSVISNLRVSSDATAAQAQAINTSGLNITTQIAASGNNAEITFSDGTNNVVVTVGALGNGAQTIKLGAVTFDVNVDKILDGVTGLGTAGIDVSGATYDDDTIEIATNAILDQVKVSDGVHSATSTTASATGPHDLTFDLDGGGNDFFLTVDGDDFVQGNTLNVTVQSQYTIGLKETVSGTQIGTDTVVTELQLAANPNALTNLSFGGSGALMDLSAAALQSKAAGADYTVTFDVETAAGYTAELQKADGSAVDGAKYSLNASAAAGTTIDLGRDVVMTYTGSNLDGGSIYFGVNANVTEYTFELTNDGGTTSYASKTVSAGETVDFGNGITLTTDADTLANSTNTTFEVINTTVDKSLSMQVGANNGQTMSIDISDMRSDALGISAASSSAQIVDEGGQVVSDAAWTSDEVATDGTTNQAEEYALSVSDAKKATAAIKVIDAAIAIVSSERSKLGAFQNRLEHTINNLGASSENLTAAESRIRDVDMAKEMMEFTKNNILSQAAQAMLAQANQQPQGVLQLLR